MGFHSRHISDDSLIAFAKNELGSFDTYMRNADSYNLTGEYASCFWDFYQEEKEARESLWNILRNESENKDHLINTVCKLWETATNEKNNFDQLEGILNYLDLAGKIGEPEENAHIKKLIEILKERVKKNINNE
jgi:hypothetical protein